MPTMPNNMEEIKTKARTLPPLNILGTASSNTTSTFLKDTILSKIRSGKELNLSSVLRPLGYQQKSSKHDISYQQSLNKLDNRKKVLVDSPTTDQKSNQHSQHSYNSYESKQVTDSLHTETTDSSIKDDFKKIPQVSGVEIQINNESIQDIQRNENRGQIPILSTQSEQHQLFIQSEDNSENMKLESKHTGNYKPYSEKIAFALQNNDYTKWDDLATTSCSIAITINIYCTVLLLYASAY